MRRTLFTLRAALAGGLLLAAGAAWASPPAPLDTAFAALQNAYARAVAPGEQADLHGAMFALVFSRVQRSYATDVDLAALAGEAQKVLASVPDHSGDPAELFKKSINAALRTLDPYSRYLDPRAHSNERAESTGSFVGLGIEVENSEAGVRIISPMPGGPAEKAGLQAGDVIVRIGDVALAGMALADATSRLRGEAGTSVALTIRREGHAGDFDVAVTRDTIRRQALRWHMEGDVLVLRLRTFSGPVTAQLEQAVGEAKEHHAPQAIVLDLRGNGGGLLREGVGIADAFLSRGDIVSLRGRTTASRRSWQADANELLAGLPMVVLIDQRSASAAELVADALQANGRAKVMGTRSYGKGSVQTTYPLGAERGALKITTSLYHGPTGRTVQKEGVDPDIVLLARNKPQAKDKDGKPRENGSGARVEEERCVAVYKAADPALSCAVAYLAAGGLEALAPANHE